MENSQKKVTLFGKIIRIILIVILSPILIVYAIARKLKKRKNDKANAEKVQIFDILQIDSLSGVEFEEVAKQLFEGLGYRAKLTKATGDYGADIIVEKDGSMGVVQVKCYSKVVGSHAVQEVLGAMQHYGAAQAFVITNNYFSKEAQTIALENKIILIDRTTLLTLLKKVKVYVWRKKYKFSALSDGAVREIESRYNFWI